MGHLDAGERPQEEHQVGDAVFRALHLEQHIAVWQVLAEAGQLQTVGHLGGLEAEPHVLHAARENKAQAAHHARAERGHLGARDLADDVFVADFDKSIFDLHGNSPEVSVDTSIITYGDVHGQQSLDGVQ